MPEMGPVVMVAWNVPAVPGNIPGAAHTVGILQGNTTQSVTVCQTWHDAAGATSGGIEIAWQYITGATYVATGDPLTVPQDEEA